MLLKVAISQELTFLNETVIGCHRNVFFFLGGRDRKDNSPHFGVSSSSVLQAHECLQHIHILGTNTYPCHPAFIVSGYRGQE